jgi:AbrB family looped-hinge helix DNA binding protein
MTSAKLSTKGQIVIPKELRDARKWSAGMDIDVIDTPEGILLKLRTPPKRYTLDDVIGIAKHNGPRVSEEEMREAIAEGAVARYERSRR